MKTVKDPFVTDVGVWSLREGERLRATIEVARFAPDASPGRRSFQRSIIAQMGQSTPRIRRTGDTRVYIISANKQALYVWFTGIHLVVLSTSAEYRSPRSLLRAAIGSVQP